MFYNYINPKCDIFTPVTIENWHNFIGILCDKTIHHENNIVSGSDSSSRSYESHKFRVEDITLENIFNGNITCERGVRMFNGKQVPTWRCLYKNTEVMVLEQQQDPRDFYAKHNLVMEVIPNLQLLSAVWDYKTTSNRTSVANYFSSYFEDDREVSLLNSLGPLTLYELSTIYTIQVRTHNGGVHIIIYRRDEVALAFTLPEDFMVDLRSTGGTLPKDQDTDKLIPTIWSQVND